jgi:hypothetical protein
MVRSHERVTRLSSTGERSRVETEEEVGAEPLTADTISETARVCAGPESTGAVLASGATADVDLERAAGDAGARRWPADE